MDNKKARGLNGAVFLVFVIFLFAALWFTNQFDQREKEITWKLAILIAVAVLSVLFFRPFCKWVCPLGAFYGLMNKLLLLYLEYYRLLLVILVEINLY